MILLLALGCSDEPDADVDSPPVAHSGEGDTGDTGLTTEPPTTGDTGLPCAEEETPWNGADDDCDGWGDEYGYDWPLLPEGTVLLRTEQPWSDLGIEFAAGRGSDGAVWVAAGNTGGNPLSEVLATPIGGASLRVVAEEYYDYLAPPAIGHFDGTTASLVVGSQLYEGTGELGPTQHHTIVPTETGSGGPTTGDLDGDGRDELVLGVWSDLRIMDGPVTPSTWDNEVARITATYPPVQNFAYRVGEIADLTGDGIPEIPVFSEEDGGRAWVVPGNVSGSVDLQDVAVALHGEEPLDDAGWFPAAGDANGDGYQDLLVGAPLAADRWGKAYLVLGPILADGMLADGIAQVVGDWERDWCGASVDFLADEDGDGTDELVVGCPRDRFGAPYPMPGRVQVYRGADAVGVLGVDEAANVLVGDSYYDLAGWRLNTRHDADGDGRDDLLVSIPLDATDDGGDVKGAVFLFPGPLLQ